MPEELAHNEPRLERFRREARLLAALNHPNIATIHSLGEDGPLQFLTMELVSGKGLAHLIDEGPFSVQRSLTIGRQIEACPGGLRLEATPGVALAGDPLDFLTSGGDPGRINALTVTEVDGSPFFFIVITGTFDGAGRHSFSTITPNNHAGLEIGFRSLGFTPVGLEFSWVESVSFQ